MGEFHNMPFNNGYSFNWTQSYPALNLNFATSVSNEMAVIEAIDRLVESGLTHPVADSILKALVNNFKE
jgi:hypothetical protein